MRRCGPKRDPGFQSCSKTGTSVFDSVMGANASCVETLWNGWRLEWADTGREKSTSRIGTGAIRKSKLVELNEFRQIKHAPGSERSR